MDAIRAPRALSTPRGSTRLPPYNFQGAETRQCPEAALATEDCCLLHILFDISLSFEQAVTSSMCHILRGNLFQCHQIEPIIFSMLHTITSESSIAQRGSVDFPPRSGGHNVLYLPHLHYFESLGQVDANELSAEHAPLLIVAKF